MRSVMLMVVPLAVLFSAQASWAARPNETRYPNLVKSWEALQNAKNHLKAAEEAHAKHGGLGGHANDAWHQLDAAEKEIDEAVMFAETHTKPGKPGVVTPKPPLTAVPDDVKYPNLGDARLQTEWAIRHVENAEQYHGPTGTLGGHGAKAVEHMREALRQIGEAERFADTHK